MLSVDREIKRLSQYLDESAGNSIIQDYTIVIDEVLSNLDLRSHGYTLSECRDLINKKFEEDGIDIFIDNKQLKKYLINKYGNQVCFAYSRKKV